ncbi:MAG: hypothetical protein IJ666_01835 [Ruminococcus sp.]|nr:hypothetical protein [Ruminococcus sp.]
MELIISSKGHKYFVTDKKGRTLYSVKKKGFGAGRYVLLDASDYHLYSLTSVGEERKPVFNISHNDRGIISLTCKSMFLDPTIIVNGKDTSGTDVKYELASKDHKDFAILMGIEEKKEESDEEENKEKKSDDERKVGGIKTIRTATGDLQYEIEIDNKIFDDFIPLFAVAIDLAFGEKNRA